MVATARQIDEAKLGEFLGRAVGDFGATFSAGLVVLGDKLGLYKAMAGAGPLTPAELAQRTGTVERYVAAWMLNQAAGGYLEYDPRTGRYLLPDEHALALADEDSPYFVAGGFQLITAALKAEPRMEQAFRSGDGILWGDHDKDLYAGTERFFRPGYVGNLLSSWLPAMDGVLERLEAGAIVADIGCGHGASTVLMAEAFPKARFFGFDSHAGSIEAARIAAQRAGVERRASFALAGAEDFPGEGYRLIAFFDCLHDMGDPVAAMEHAREAIAPDGSLLIVEPMAGETVEDNLNPVGRVFSAGSVLLCTPHAMATGGRGLGTLATEAALRATVLAGGFTRFERVAETPFNRVFQARP